ncbi:MFS transporter [Streptomyces sp. CG4]|uniref:MFS transporter n=1 Tax=Streptomyces sp. CG4 TaxID=408783 RepID=UPI0034E2EE45
MPATAGARRAREKNPPAVRHHTLHEAARNPVLWLMWLCLLGAAGVTVLGICLLTAYGRRLGLGGPTVWSVTVAGGATAAVAGVLSDRSGRRTALITACLVPAAAQFGVLVAARTGSGVLLLGCAAAAGAAVPALVTAPAADHFGENHSASVHGLLTGAWLLPVAAGRTRAASYAARDPHSAFLLAGCTGLVCAVVALFLRAPGRLSVRRIDPSPHPLGEEMA